MMSRRTFLVAGAGVTSAAFILPAERGKAEDGASVPPYVLGATAVTQVFGDGLRLVAVAVQHDRPVDQAALAPALYSVEGRTVTRVFAAVSPDPATEGDGGDYVILELSPDDSAAALLHRDPATRLPAAASVTIATGVAADASSPVEGGPPDVNSIPRLVATSSELNLVIDDFAQGRFEDPETGDALGYNIFVPQDRDPSTVLPLVLFMHDAGSTSTVLETTLAQGLGAVSWASPEDQAKHPAIVLAPQYAAQVVDDASTATSLLDTTLHLIETIAAEQNVDRNRIYLTGQSGGGMMSIEMMVRRPEAFAAAFLVACQWDPGVVRPLARQRLWVMVSEGDEKAFPGQTAIMEVIEGEGAVISRAHWDATSDAETFAAAVADQAAEGAAVNFTVLNKGTVVPEGQPDNGGMNHVNTWRIAYDIPGIRDWIMQQVRAQ